MTYVYAGYYDDREDVPEVKIVAIVHENATHNFTCIVDYLQKNRIETTGYIKLHHRRILPPKYAHAFRNGYVICHVLASLGQPRSVTLKKINTESFSKPVIVWPPSKKNNTITRCIKPFVNQYDDVARVVWNMEMFQMLGVDKHVIYLDNQTQRIVKVLESYVSEGVVELRNFSIQPEVSSERTFWAEWSTYHDCLLSQRGSAKYVLFMDFDEIIVPRRHSTLVELADDIFTKSDLDLDHDRAGALLFRNVFFPTFLSMSLANFSFRDQAMEFSIHPLLFNTRMKTNGQFIMPKALVRPDAIDEMTIHYVKQFKPGWRHEFVGEDTASIHHYRAERNEHMNPPQSQDYFMLKFADRLVSAVKSRFERLGMKP